MTYYVSKATSDLLIAYIKSNYETYLALIRTASGLLEIPRIEQIKKGNDYTQKGLLKPFMLIDPVSTPIDEEAVECIHSELLYDVLIAVDGYDNEQVTEYSECYADAFISMILSNDRLGSQVYHASVVNIESFPGGTGTIRYVLLSLEITVETDRS